MPRLADFDDRYPEIDLAIDSCGEVVELRSGGIDIVLRFGRGNWSGLESELLFQSPIVVLAHPDLVGDRLGSSSADLLVFPWQEEMGQTRHRTGCGDKGLNPICAPVG